MMRLLVTTPTAVIVDVPDVVALRAEDESGSFGILSGHADFLTALAICVVTYRRATDGERYCAVRGGTLLVSSGSTVEIATREGLAGDSLDHLEHAVLAAYRDAIETERAARVDTARLNMKAVRQIIKYLRPDRMGAVS
jgi:F-type H+-transporting ATPase subunit epsilon